MKKILSATIISLLLASCNFGKIEIPEAKQLVESLLNDIKNNNYSELDKYYIASFNESEPAEKKKEKYDRLRNVMGDITAYECISATEKYNESEGINQLELIYKVTCSRITVKQTFLVIKDEGSLKIIFQNIENYNWGFPSFPDFSLLSDVSPIIHKHPSIFGRLFNQMPGLK